MGAEVDWYLLQRILIDFQDFNVFVSNFKNWPVQGTYKIVI